MSRQLKGILNVVLAFVLCFALVVSVACDDVAKDWSSDETGHWYQGKDGSKVGFAAHQYADDADTTCDICGYVRIIQPQPHEHSWSSEWTTDGNNHWHACDGCSETKDVAPHQYTDDADTTCDICGYVRTIQPQPHEHSWSSEWTTDDNNHWHTCDGCDQVNDLGAHQFENNVCTVCGYGRIVPPEVEYETVTTVCDLAALWQTYGEGIKITEDVTQGKFTFQKGLYFNQQTGDLTGCVVNTQKKNIIITFSGADNQNSISFDAKHASSTYGKLTLIDQLGNVVHDFGTIDSVKLGLTADNIPAGTYILKSEQSIRIGNLQITEKLEKSSAVGITVSGAPSKDLSGREFSSKGLVVTLNYANGRKEVISSGYTVDSSSVDMSTGGVYTVTVSYKPDGSTETFTDSYELTIYQVESVQLSDHSVDNKYVTHPVQKVFALGEVFNHDYLAVSVTAKVPNSEETETFILSDSEYTISNVTDVNVAGTKTVTVTVGSVNAQYNVYYVDATGTLSEVVVTTDTVGISKETGGYTAGSVNLAIQLFKAFNVDQNQVKTITVKNGEYKEKVEIDLPNVRLIGEGTAVLWCDILAGQRDPSNTSAYSTEGSASVSIRESAVGFYAENITFKNYYNTHALYTASKALMSDTQAVACLVQADKAYFYNCTFTSYHDTLFAMRGRQVYESCNIEGRTDYIFGYNATCLFKNCVIKSLNGNDSKNGGYVVATKGTSGLLYGYIFDGCVLTAEEGVTPGTISLARGWDHYMTIAYINCNISDKFSLEAIGEKTMVDDGSGNLVEAKDNKNDRYTNMNAIAHPELLFEYNNTGAGALTAEMFSLADANGLIADVCTVPTAQQAAQFTNPAIIFAKLQQREGATDFATSYIDDWDGTAGSKITVTTLNFAIFEQNYKGVTVQDHFADDLEFVIPDSITNSSLRWNGNSIQVDIGCTIKVKTAGTIAVDWYGHPYGSAANGVISYKDGYASIEIINCAGCSGVYIKSITIDTENIPADTVWYNVTFNYNYDGAPEATVVKAASGNLVVAVAQPTREGYNFVGWFLGDEEYNFNTLVSQDIALVAHWEEVTDQPVDDPEADILKIGQSITFGSEGNHSQLEATGKLVVTGGNIRDNGGNNSETSGMTLAIKVKAGTVVVFNGYPNYTNYTLQIDGSVVSGDETVTASEWRYTVEADCTLNIVCGSNCYFYSIVAEAATVTPTTKTVEVTFSADDLALQFKNGKLFTDNDLFSASDAKTLDVVKDAVTATADDGSDRTFDYALLPTGPIATVTIKAKANITVTVYYTVSDANFTKKEASKSGVVSYTIDGVTTTETAQESKSNKVAYAITFTLNAGETVTVQSNANRLVIFGIIATEQ